MLAPMAVTDSSIDAEEMARVRRLLADAPLQRAPMWPAVAAAAFAAISALCLAAAMVVAPPVVVEHPLEQPR